MKYTFETEDMNEADQLMKAAIYRQAIDEVWTRCFRPNNKHGYDNTVLDKIGANDIIEALAEIYRDIIEEMEI